MDYEKVAPQLGDWAPKFKSFIESVEFDKIYAFLKKESSEGKIICPKHSDVFRAFRETPLEKLRCIFLLQDPYPWIKNGVFVADGIAMSCGNTGICQPSLKLFYDGIADDLKIKVPYHPDLSYLCKQGVLFLNTSLTVEANKSNSHEGLWNKFMEFMVEEVINFYTRGIIYVSFGENAHVMTKAIVPFLHWGFQVEHPTYAARQERGWNHDNIFSKVNKILKDCNNETIKWAYDQT